MNDTILVVVLTVQVINAAFAVYAGGVAEEKGYSNVKWGVVCFFFGIVGYSLLAALPDLETRAMLKRIEMKLSTNGSNATMLPISDSTSQKKKSAVTPISDSTSQKKTSAVTWNTKGEWKCPRCGTLNQRDALFCKDCGEYK